MILYHRLMPLDVLERLKPLFSEARQAFLRDPAYAIELAKQGSLVSARKEARRTVTLGRNADNDV